MIEVEQTNNQPEIIDILYNNTSSYFWMGCRYNFDINMVGKAAMSHCQIYYLKVLNL